MGMPHPEISTSLKQRYVSYNVYQPPYLYLQRARKARARATSPSPHFVYPARRTLVEYSRADRKEMWEEGPCAS
jgi:hypothetical protein